MIWVIFGTQTFGFRPPPPDPDFIVGKDDIYKFTKNKITKRNVQKEILIWAIFWDISCWVPDPPPPLFYHIPVVGRLPALFCFHPPQAKNRFHFRMLSKVTVPGKSEILPIYEVLAPIRGLAALKRPTWQNIKSPVDSPSSSPVARDRMYKSISMRTSSRPDISTAMVVQEADPLPVCHPRVAEAKGPLGRPQRGLDRRLEEVAKAVGGGYCRLQMPLKLALGVRETVAGHRLGALEGRGYLPPFQCIPVPAPDTASLRVRRKVGWCRLGKSFPFFQSAWSASKLHQRNLKEMWRGCGKMGKTEREKMGKLSKIVPLPSDFPPISDQFHTFFIQLPKCTFGNSPHFPTFLHFPPFPPISPHPP